ncbi:MAG: PEP-utilizing enzyme, partial [Marinobacter sp.]|nr:PEP-utilizing enzyme [Marinobacter sp.]
LSQPAMDAFLNSIRTVSHRFTEDAAQTASGDLSWAEFVSRYGHLRPGTYDITSPSYADQPEHFLRPVVERASGKEPEHSSPEPWLQERERFAEALAKAGLDGDADTIERFMREAIEGREYAKFVFTRHLSRALDCLARFGKRHDLERDQIALVPVEALLALRSGTLGVADERAWLLRQVDEGREALQAAAMVELPPLLTSEQDFYTFLYAENQANFIGKKRVSADCVDLQRASDDDKASLAGKIALIPQADPGYDWLFGHGIAGLITMYGGANSHMAIRAAEFGLPAAIGVGEALYGKLASSAALELDPANQRIQVVR